MSDYGDLRPYRHALTVLHGLARKRIAFDPKDYGNLLKRIEDRALQAKELSPGTLPGDFDRIIKFASQLGIAVRDGDGDYANDAYRALPDHLQQLVDRSETDEQQNREG